jgi:hypothetical protein
MEALMMRKAKIRFERVPVALARKILADELKRKQTLERLQSSTNKELQECPVAKTTERKRGK